MKVLIIAKSLPDSFKGGIQTHIWELSKWLIKLDVSVSILTTSKYGTPEKREVIDEREIIRIPSFPGRKIPLLRYYLDEILFNRAVVTWLKKNAKEFDVIHLQGRSGNLYPTFKFGKKEFPPSVLTVHSTSKSEYRLAGNRGRLTKIEFFIHQFLSTRIEKKAIKYSDLTISVSNSLIQDIKNDLHLPTDKIRVIYNGIDTIVFRRDKSIEEDSNLLIYIGRLNAVKGLDNLVKAMTHTNPNIRLGLIGNGPEKDRLCDLIEKLKLSSRISLIGELDMDDIVKWINKARALVLPSNWESQGIVLMEANACGKAVIATNVFGIKEVVKNDVNGLLVDCGNIQQLADSINRVFDSDELCLRLGENGRKMMEEKFSWERIARETIRCYRSVIDGKK